MHIKTTADIVNEVNWHGLTFTQRYILKTMIDLSFNTRIIPRKKIFETLNVSKYLLTVYLKQLREKGFIERHIINGRCYYETIPFTERVPCI